MGNAGGRGVVQSYSARLHWNVATSWTGTSNQKHASFALYDMIVEAEEGDTLYIRNNFGKKHEWEFMDWGVYNLIEEALHRNVKVRAFGSGIRNPKVGYNFESLCDQNKKHNKWDLEVRIPRAPNHGKVFALRKGNSAEARMLIGSMNLDFHSIFGEWEVLMEIQTIPCPGQLFTQNFASLWASALPFE